MPVARTCSRSSRMVWTFATSRIPSFCAGVNLEPQQNVSGEETDGMQLVRSQALFQLVLFIALSLMVGCGPSARPLMPTPAVYQNPGGIQPFPATPAERQTTDMRLLYITDRSPETDQESELPYGESRSRSIAFGSAVVNFVPNLDWKNLEHQSQLAERTRTVNLELGEVSELGRFSRIPLRLGKNGQRRQNG